WRRRGASMEPRRDRRGFRALDEAAQQQLQPELQWSLGVIAEDSVYDSEIQRGWPDRLQWSLGVIAEDSGESSSFRARHTHRASMEPRRDRRGFSGSRDSALDNDPASMEPRRDRRGFPRDLRRAAPTSSCF